VFLRRRRSKVATPDLPSYCFSRSLGCAMDDGPDSLNVLGGKPPVVVDVPREWADQATTLEFKQPPR